MAISQIPLASTGLTASDLVTQPSYTLIGSYLNATYVSMISINLTNPSLYRSLHVEFNAITANENTYLYMRLNSESSSTAYRIAAQGMFQPGSSQYANVFTNSEVASGFKLTHKQYVRENKSGWIDIHNVNSTEKKVIKGRIGYTATIYGINHLWEDLHGDANISSSITSIQFYPDYSGINTYGGIFVYGVN
jgi:hypothetical protein